MKYFLLFFIGFTLTHCSPSKPHAEDSVDGKNDFPIITLITPEGEKIAANTLPGNTILIFFNPDCDHCQRQATEMQKQIGVFKNYSLYFVGSNPAPELNQFAYQYGLKGYPNVFFVQAEAEEVSKVMGAIGVPSLYIYSSNKKLVKKFDNETLVEEIAKFL